MSVPTNSPHINPLSLFPLDADYLFNYTHIGLPVDIHSSAEITSQAVTVAAAFIVSPAAALNIARGFVLSRIASCSDRDPLANGQRWVQKKLFFPETLFSAKKIGDESGGEPDSLGFGPKGTAYYLRFAVLGWFILMLAPMFLTLIFVRPVAPLGKVIATFFSIRVAVWGFQSGLLVGDVSSPLFSKSAGDSSETMIVDYVLGLVPILLPVIALVYFSIMIHPEITSPIVDEEVEELEITISSNNKKKKQQQDQKNINKKKKKKNQQQYSDDDEDDEEMVEELDEDGEDKNNKKETKNDEDDDEVTAKMIADRKKRKQTKPHLYMAISKVQFAEPGILFGDAKKKKEEEQKKKEEAKNAKKQQQQSKGKKSTAASPAAQSSCETTVAATAASLSPKTPEKTWRSVLKNWLNDSKIARFLFIGNYCWEGGDLPVLNISSFEELEKKKKLRIETKKKQLEEDIKSGKRKRKWYEPLPTDSDEDEDGGSGRFQSSAVVQKNRYLSRGNFFDDDEEGDDNGGGGGGGGGGFFDDENADGDDENKQNENDDEENNNKPAEGEGEEQQEEEKPKNEDDVDMNEEEKKAQERKKLFDTSLDHVLPKRPPITPAQLIFNRLGSVLEDFYGPPAPLSIEEANRRNVRLPWREAFATITPHYFAFSVLVTTATCIFSGLSAAAPDKYCTIALLVSIVMSGADLLFLALCFPYIIPVQNVLGFASDGVVVAAGILALLKLPPQEQERLYLVQGLTLLLVSLIGAVRIGLAVIRFCLLFFGKIAIVSIYYGKRDRDIRRAQRKLRLEEAKEKEKQRRESEKKDSSAVVKKKGGPYAGVKSLEESMLDDDNDDLLLMPLPKIRASSRFSRRRNTNNTNTINDDDEDDATDRREEEYLLYSPAAAASSASSSPSSTRKKRGERKERTSSLLSGSSSRRNINMAEI